MKKINSDVILLVAILAGIFLWSGMNAKAAENAATPSNQVVNDEGYGNSDEEYYNSEDDRVNDVQENADTNDSQTNAYAK